MTEPTLRAEGITKRFLGVTALDGVDFDVRAGEVHALVGENGAGKSTLIKVLTGAYRADEGTIHLDGEPVAPRDVADAQTLGIGTVYQEVNLLPNLTIAENIFLGREPRRWGLIDQRTVNRNARTLLAGYGISVDVDAPLGTYPVAVRQIVAIARAVDISGRVLILDEPTASLDAAEVDRLLAIVARLKGEGLGIVFITHFLGEVFRAADRVTVLRNGRRVATCATSDIRRLDLVAMMLGRELKAEEARPRRQPAAGEPVARFRRVGRRGRIAPFDLDVRRGEAVGVAGLLGSGRTETAEVLFGAVPADSGTIEVDGSRVGITSPRAAVAHGFGFCPEDRKQDGIAGELTVRENIVLALQARRGWGHPLSRKASEAIAERWIAALDIRTASAETPMKFLSGGNQQKAILARWLATDPRFLILDEPTRGIDVGAHDEIVRLIERLCAEGMSLLVISSELAEMVAYATRVRVLSDRHHVADLVGADVTVEAVMRAIAAGAGAAGPAGAAVSDVRALDPEPVA